MKRKGHFSYYCLYWQWWLTQCVILWKYCMYPNIYKSWRTLSIYRYSQKFLCKPCYLQINYLPCESKDELYLLLFIFRCHPPHPTLLLSSNWFLRSTSPIGSQGHLLPLVHRVTFSHWFTGLPSPLGSQGHYCTIMNHNHTIQRQTVYCTIISSDAYAYIN